MIRSSKSTIRSGRTIGEQREHLETASERASIHKKNKAKKNLRIGITTSIFVAIIVILIIIIPSFLKTQTDDVDNQVDNTIIVPYAPTIEIIDNASSSPDTTRLTSRMNEFIGQVEADFRELGYVPIKAVIPTDSIREVDLYLDGYNGYIKMLIDRGAGVSVEDADRMLRYLTNIEVTEFEYIDVRVERKAYWK